jgi:uncharacterized protein (TIGR02266 family)
MATYGPESSSDFDIDFSLTEFAELDRRRLFGAPALVMTEVEYWLELRARLEHHLGKAQPESAGDADGWLGAERREFIRLPTHIRIQFAEPAEAEPRIARDISQGGLFIATRRPLGVGSEVRLQIEKPDSVIEVRGMVAWVQTEASPERPAGMGIRFGKLRLDQRRAITRLVQDAVFEE